MSRQISAWQREIRRNPGSAAFARLADRLREEGRLDEATWVCARGLAANPRYSTGHAILGEILHQVGLKARAKEEFLLALDLDVHNARARLRLVGLLLEEGEAQKALEHLESILFWQPHHEEAQSLAKQARALLRSRQIEAVIGPQQEELPQPGEGEEALVAPPGLVAGREGELARRVAECESVGGVMIVNREGLLVANEAAFQELKDEAAAGLASMCETSNRYLLKLGLGYLEGGLIEEKAGAIRIFRYQGYLMAVLLKEGAKLGAAEVEIRGAIDRLDRRRKLRASDTLSDDLPAETKHA